MAAQIQGIGPTVFPASTSAKGVLGKDDFLKLLVSQLQNQDPMNPTDGTAFAAQLAQFSSVEQLQNINTTLQSSIDSTTLMNQSISNALATNVIGKEVRASGTSFNYTGSGDMKLGYSLPSAAVSTDVQIVDQSGTVIRTISGTGVAVGDNDVKWDGLTDKGTQAVAGKYTIKAVATDAKSASITSTPYFYGVVTGVRFKSTGTVFVVDGSEINLADVLEVSAG